MKVVGIYTEKQVLTLNIGATVSKNASVKPFK